MWHAYVAASRIPDPAYAALRTFAAGSALNVWVEGLADLQTRGLVSRGDVTVDPKIVELEPADAPTTVQINDCVDTSKTQLYKLSGAAYTDTPGGRRSTTATVTYAGGAWKVTAIAIHKVGSC